MDVDYINSPQPWEIPLDEDKRRMLGMVLPGISGPLATDRGVGPGISPLMTSGPSTVPLADTPAPPKLSTTAPSPAPLADTWESPGAGPAPKSSLAERYGDVQSQIQRESQKVQEPHLNIGRRILGTLLSLSTNPQMAEAGYKWTHPAEVEQQRKLGVLEKQAAGVKTQEDIAEKERLPTEKPEVPHTVETGDGVFQWNPDTNRYDIRVGGPKGATKPDTATQNKEKFQAIIGKVDSAKIPTGPNDLQKGLDAALQRKAITPEEHQFAKGYLAANPTPTTAITVSGAEAQTKQDIKERSDYYTWKTPDGKIVSGQGKDKPQGVVGEPIGDAKAYAQHRREAMASNVVQDSLNRVAKDVDEHPEIFDHAGARSVLATATDERQAQGIGLLVMGTGGHISTPSGSGKIIDTLLENNAVPKEMRRALKDYIADYWAMKDKAITQQMELQGGKLGRTSQMITQAIIDQIPGGGTADSQMAMRQVANLQQTQNRISSQYADEGKTQPYQMKGQQSGGGGGRRPVIVDGKTVGYATPEEYKAGKMYDKP